MIRKLHFLLLFTIPGFLTISCDKDAVTPGVSVDIYLLESFETIDHFCQIDESSIVLQNEPLIRYQDIVSYNSSEYIFSLSSQGQEAIEDFDLAIHGQAFAVTVDGEPIYTAFFWASFSSAMCQWVVADPLFIGNDDGLKINLGYPGTWEGFEIPDKRNDPRLLAVFKKDGKLIK